jgi:putative tryptophan/tyrosine transport system substrate-binding protein
MIAKLLWSVAFLVLAAKLADAQPDKRVARIGLLSTSPMSALAGRLEAFQQGLRDIGYVEGKNIAIAFRSTEGKLKLANELASELVRLKVDVIVTTGGTSTRPARQATSTIPIVMAQDVDPVGNGFVASLARPGGNITGLSTLSPELNGKQLELLKEIVPKLEHVVVFGYSSGPANAQALKETKTAARALGLQVQHVDVLEPKALETAFQTSRTNGADALLVLSSPISFSYRKEIVERAIKSRLPAIYWAPEFVEAGGLLTYSVSFTDLFRRAAYYVDKILKGVKPADLPVEQPTKFELIINLKAAKQIGLIIPPHILARADRVIK